ncbi:uL15 family ribosomal protein [Candidatus Woesearchaeota archaeon]|nr:uL15 family ribosomal protein [Candidatus Woesearchaeota archaeon]
MTVNKRKKNVRMRGSKTHGWGAMKKHRGAGNRGGRGNAGSGKRGDARKQHFVTETEPYFGKHGFTSLKKSQRSITLFDLEQKLPSLLAKGVIGEKNGTYVLNLHDHGYDKLLGKGAVVRQWNITVKAASQPIIEKIKKAGGTVVLLSKKSEEEKKHVPVEKRSDESA